MNDLQHYWGELTATALVGTARQSRLPQPTPAAPDALAALLAQLSDRPDPAERLLSAAVAVTLAMRAGALPTSAPAEEIAPAPADARPPCGPRSARHLAALLTGPQRALLPEWLAALRASGRRPPAALLPALLDVARGDHGLRPLALAAAGAGGQWLARLNPEWAFAAAGAGAAAHNPAALGELWQTSARNGRVFLLQALRADDPAQARALIASTWASDKADERAAFVAALADGLSAADEPFLEAALDDRGKEVRARAADLLARLPDSRLAARMAARALALVRRSGGLLPKIEVGLPEACDKAMQRDGVEPKPPRGTGERAWWLSEIIRRTPPAAWGAAWGLTPAKILATRTAKEWRSQLIEGWSAAAVAYHDAEWAAALADLAPRETVPVATLIAAVPAARREPLLIQLLGDGRPLGRDHPALAALRAAPGPWGHALARAVVGALARRLAHADDSARSDWHLRAALEEFALAIPPELADEAVGALPAVIAETPFWADTALAFAERLRLRREMLAALSTGA
jgi:hypothetical protein